MRSIMAFPLVLALCCSARAQTVNDEQPKNGEKPVAEQPDKEKAAAAEARAHVSQFAVTTVTEGREAAVEMIERPLLLFGDATRQHEAGSVWGWGHAGRPVALLELFRNVGPNQPWMHTITLTSPSVVRMKCAGGVSWSPRTSDFELHDVPNTEPASDKPTVRLRQMKDISRRFAAHEFWNPNNSRFELRLLVQPIHRYSDADAKLGHRPQKHRGGRIVFARQSVAPRSRFRARPRPRHARDTRGSAIRAAARKLVRSRSSTTSVNRQRKMITS